MSSSTPVEDTSRRLRSLSVDKKNKFLENWTPENSNRETRKLTRKTYSESRKPARTVYDLNGCLANGEDLCDCLEAGCPGCHFPCPKCSSLKCGHECRRNRKWIYDNLEVDGQETRNRGRRK